MEIAQKAAASGVGEAQAVPALPGGCAQSGPTVEAAAAVRSV